MVIEPQQISIDVKKVIVYLKDPNFSIVEDFVMDVYLFIRVGIQGIKVIISVLTLIVVNILKLVILIIVIAND